MDEVRAIEMYESPDGAVRLDVRSDGQTVWLGDHLSTVFAEGELDRSAAV